MVEVIASTLPCIYLYKNRLNGVQIPWISFDEINKNGSVDEDPLPSYFID
jgi:hypothetical protein